MLEYLKLTNAGPASAMELELAPRLNILTGDNGLGKSFLLDVAWWVLTRKWPHDLNARLTSGYPVRPIDPKKRATIKFRITSKRGAVEYESAYSARDEAWTGKSGRPWNPGLIIYAHADGGFSVWDPARNYWKKKGNIDVQERLPGYVFSPADIWNGLTASIEGREVKICKGLVDDWAVWIRENGENARTMGEIVRKLSPRGESMVAGPLTRLSASDSQDIPTLRTSYGQNVPILHASSGVRRIVSLAYMLLWSWNEHAIAAEHLGEKRASQVIFLFDEIESHLHPRWQRCILGALRDVAGVLHGKAKVQLLIATHSPLILASAEPWFDPKHDAWFDLDLEGKPPKVVLRSRDYTPHGSAGNWLTSEAFDLETDRGSVEAEDAILRAKDLLRKGRPDPDEVLTLHKDLRAVLSDLDPFWVRWHAFVKQLGIAE